MFGKIMYFHVGNFIVIIIINVIIIARGTGKRFFSRHVIHNLYIDGKKIRGNCEAYLNISRYPFIFFFIVIVNLIWIFLTHSRDLFFLMLGTHKVGVIAILWQFYELKHMNVPWSCSSCLINERWKAIFFRVTIIFTD